MICKRCRKAEPDAMEDFCDACIDERERLANEFWAENERIRSMFTVGAVLRHKEGN